MVRIVGRADRVAADELRLRDEPSGDASGSDDSDPDGNLFLSQHCTGDSLCSWQIDNLAEFLHVVEISFPVRAYREDIDIVSLDIINLLALVLFNDHLVGIPRILDSLDPFHHTVPCVELSALHVEVVRGHADNQIVPEFFRPSEKIDVTLMQDIKSAVCDDGFPVGAVTV